MSAPVSVEHSPARFPPPADVLSRSALLLVLLLLVPIGAGMIAGVAAAVLAGLGLGLGFAPALLLPLRPAIAFVLLGTLPAATAVHVAGDPAAVTLLVLAAAAVAGIASLRAAGALAMAPALPAATGMLELDVAPGGATAAVLAGALWVVALIHLIGVRAPADPLPPRVAGVHAVAVAVCCAAQTYAAVRWDWSHGYWMVLTTAVMLRPARSDTAVEVRERVGGTLLGGCLAAGLVLLLPSGWLMLAGIVCGVCMIAAAIQSDGVQMALFLVPMVVLLAGAGTGADALQLTFERVGWTLAAASVIASLALLLRRIDA